MHPQNFNNHRRMVPGFHYLLSSIILSCLIISSILLFQKMNDMEDGTVEAILSFFVANSLIGLFWFCRTFALKAQDRAIRAEENFRHFILTGKPLPTALRLSQIIALRFASDAELPELAQLAVAEKLRATEIKKKIVHWREDHHRV